MIKDEHDDGEVAGRSLHGAAIWVEGQLNESLEDLVLAGLSTLRRHPDSFILWLTPSLPVCRGLLTIPGTSWVVLELSIPPGGDSCKIHVLLTRGPEMAGYTDMAAVIGTAFIGWNPRSPSGAYGDVRIRARSDEAPRIPIVARETSVHIGEPLPLIACVAQGDEVFASPARVVEQYQGCRRWTDGSVQDIYCGAAYVQQAEDGSWETFPFSLPDGLTIDVCEAFAIRAAVLSVPDTAPCATIFSDSAATLLGLLKFSTAPHVYRFKEQYQIFGDIVERIWRGSTQFWFVKVKAHTDAFEGGLAINDGNRQADKVAKEAALSEAHCNLPGHAEPSIFGLWMRNEDDALEFSPPSSSTAAGVAAAVQARGPRPGAEWERVSLRTLRRRLYQRGLSLYVLQEASRTYKDARDLATGFVLSPRLWVHCATISLDDRP